MAIVQLLPILFLGAIFWVLLIRPQQKARRLQAELQSALSPGDDVSTIGGILGRVTDVDGTTVGLEVAEGVVMRFDRRAVNRIVRDVPADEVELEEDADDVVDEAPSEEVADRSPGEAESGR